MIDHGHGCITPEPFDATLAAVAVAARPGALVPIGAGRALLEVSPKPPPRQHQPDRFPKA